MRSADDERELPLATDEHFADHDPLTRAVMDRMLAGVSTRRFAGVGEAVGSEVEQEAAATSKTSVSKIFVERTKIALGELMTRRLEEVRLAAMRLDGLEIAERTHIVCLGITTEGVKIRLGLCGARSEGAVIGPGQETRQGEEIETLRIRRGDLAKGGPRYRRAFR